MPSFIPILILFNILSSVPKLVLILIKLLVLEYRLVSVQPQASRHLTCKNGLCRVGRHYLPDKLVPCLSLASVCKLRCLPTLQTCKIYDLQTLSSRLVCKTAGVSPCLSKSGTSSWADRRARLREGCPQTFRVKEEKSIYRTKRMGRCGLEAELLNSTPDKIPETEC